MTMIVSSNYRNPLSQQCWLMRDGKRPYVSAIPYKTVVAHGVRFGTSPTTERGFGAKRVAFCSGAQGYDKELAIESHCFRVSFDGYNFRDAEDNVIEKCDTMYFLSNGRMYGMVCAENTGSILSDVAA